MGFTVKLLVHQAELLQLLPQWTKQLFRVLAFTEGFTFPSTGSQKQPLTAVLLYLMLEETMIHITMDQGQ